MSCIVDTIDCVWKGLKARFSGQKIVAPGASLGKEDTIRNPAPHRGRKSRKRICPQVKECRTVFPAHYTSS